MDTWASFTFICRQNSEEAVVITTEIYRVEMADLEAAFSASPGTPLGTDTGSTRPNTSQEEAVVVREEAEGDFAASQEHQVSRSPPPDELYDSLDGTLIYNQHEDVDGPADEPPPRLSTTYTVDNALHGLSGHESWEMSCCDSHDNGNHTESWQASQPGSPKNGPSDSQDGSHPESWEEGELESEECSQPHSGERSHPESWEMSHSRSRDRSQLDTQGTSQQGSERMSQPVLRGISQSDSQSMSQTGSHCMSRLDSRGASGLNSRGLSQSGSFSGDSGESNSHMGPVFTVVDSDVDTIMGEGDNPQIGTAKPQMLPHCNYVDDDPSMPPLEDDVPYKDGNVYYDGCQYTVYGEPVLCEERTSAGENVDICPSFADDNESELERLSYDEEEDYRCNKNPYDCQEPADEDDDEQISDTNSQMDHPRDVDRPDAEGAEEDEEDCNSAETNMQQCYYEDMNNGFIDLSDNQSDDGENMYQNAKIVDQCPGKFQNHTEEQQEMIEYAYDQKLQRNPEIKDEECAMEPNTPNSCCEADDRYIGAIPSGSPGGVTNEVYHEKNSLVDNGNAGKRHFHQSVQTPPVESACQIREQKIQNSDLLSRVELEEDSFITSRNVRARSAVSSKSSVRSTSAKSDDKSRSGSAIKDQSSSSHIANSITQSSRKLNSSIAFVVDMSSPKKKDVKGKKMSHTKPEPYHRPETRLCFRHDTSPSPKDTSPLNGAEEESKPIDVAPKKSVLDNFKPIPVEKSSQLFIMRGQQVIDDVTQPSRLIQNLSQSCDASYEDTSDSGRGQATRCQSGPFDQSKLLNSQKKHRLSSNKRNKRRSGGGYGSSKTQFPSDANAQHTDQIYGFQIGQETNSDSDIEKNRLSPVKQMRKHCPPVRRRHCEDVTALLESVVYHGVPLAPEIGRNGRQKGDALKKCCSGTKDTELKLAPQQSLTKQSHHNPNNPKNSSTHNQHNTNREGIRKQLFQNDDQGITCGDTSSCDGQNFINKGGGEPATPESTQCERSPSTSASSLQARNKKINFIDQNRRQLSRGQQQRSYREIFLAKKTKHTSSPITQQERDSNSHQLEQSEMDENNSSSAHGVINRSSSHSRLRSWSPQSGLSSHGEENADSRFNDSPPHSPSVSTGGSASGGESFAPRLTLRPQMPKPTISARNVKTGLGRGLRSVARDAAKEKLRQTASHISDSEESRTEGMMGSEAQHKPVKPKLSQHDLSGLSEKSDDKPKPVSRRPSRLPVLRAPRPPPRPPPPELSPVPPALALSQPPSDQDDVCSHHSQADSVDSGGDKSKYKPYTMKDYRSLHTETKMGGLGPHRNQALIQEKLQKYQRQAAYAQQVAERNRKMLFARLEKPKYSYAQLAQDAEQQNKASRRQKGIAYARTVSRPPGRGKDPQLDESATKSDGSRKGNKRQAADKDSSATTGVKLPPLINTAVKGANESLLDTSSDGVHFDDSLEMVAGTSTEETCPSRVTGGTTTRKTTENVLESLMDTSAVDKLRQRHEQEKAMVKQLCDKRGSL